MPDKHEVGGSSPLGPTSSTNYYKNGETAKPIYGGVAQLGEHLPCKQGVMGSNPIISTRGSFLEMFIENRINKRNETDSCILRKTC